MSCGWRQVGWNQQVQHLPHFLAADIESYGGLERSDSVRVRLRRHLKDWCTGLFDRAGVDPGNWVLAGHRRRLAPLDRPERLLEPATRHGALRLRERLLAYNKDSPHAERLRVRLAMHAGDVLSDPDPFVGRRPSMSAGYWTARYCATACATTQPLAVLVSAEIYQGVVRRAHGGLDPAAWYQVV